ncbi:hypothetical protein RHCRD62_110069 [Rhodococcus sp. RD6.2]|nr:hypothetical protein RHCRD62_110069 [Rhodococcus sp. RD6.2]
MSSITDIDPVAIVIAAITTALIPTGSVIT